MSTTRLQPIVNRSFTASRARVCGRARLGRRAISALVASASALCALPAIAADVTSTWSAATTGVWNADGNWINAPALGGFPNNGNGGVATYDAVISAAGSAYTVTLSTNVTVEDLTISSANATLNHTGGTFTATGAIAILAGAYQLNGGTISNTVINPSGTGSLLFGANNGNLLSGVTVNGDLTLNTASARTRIGGGTTFTTAHLAANSAELGFATGQTLTGTILFEGAGTGGRFVSMNGTPGNFTISSTGVVRTETGFAGSVQIGGGANFGGSMTLLNQGLISSQTSGRTVTIAATSFSNEGIAEAINGGILDITSTNWSNAAGGTLRTLNGSTLNFSGNWSNSGALSIDNSTLNLGGTFSTAGLNLAGFSRVGGTVNLTGTLNNSASTLTLNSATGSWTLNGGTINGGTLAFADGQSLLIAANGNNLLSGVTVNGDLVLNLASARLKIAGGTTFTTAHMGANSTGLGFAPGQTLAGTILFEGAPTGTRFVEMNGTAGTLTIGATGVMRTETGFAGSAQIGGTNVFGGAMTLLNQGLISSQTSGRTVNLVAANFTNEAIAEAINGGILDITSTNWSNASSGTLRALNGSTLSLSGNWSNSGALTIDNSTLNLGGTFSTAGLNLAGFTRVGGTVNLTGTLTNIASALTLNSATGSWTLNGGTISGGTLAFADGQTLIISANGSNLLSGVTVNGDLTLSAPSARLKIAGGTTFTTAHMGANSTGLGFAPGQTLAGTILFEGASTGTRFVEMNGTAGTFTIGATGIVRTETGLGGSAQVGGGNVFGGAMTLLNQGLISSQTSGRTVNLVAANFTNEAIAEAINGGILDISSTNWSNAASGTLRALNGSTLSLSGNWSNSGALSIDNSTLNLGGTFSTAGLNLAGFSRTGGTVNLTGTLTNTASTLTLNSATGSWTLNGGTINGGTLAFADGQNLIIASNNSNLLSGVTVNGDLVLNLASARLKIAGGTAFTTAHMAANSTGLGFAPGQTLAGTILFEGASTGTRFVEMNGTAGTFTIGAAGVLRTETGFAGSAQVGGGNVFGGAMTLLNQGLISSQTNGRTVTISATSFSNEGIAEAINGGNLDITSTNWSNVAGGTLRALNGSTLNFSGNWSNSGALSIDNSTLNLGGTFSTAGLNLAGFTRSGGTVNLIGTLTNSASTLTLNSATGSWTLNGGTINGGTLAFADGQNLIIASNNSNLLSGVTVNGDLLLNLASARTRIAGGTTFTTAHMGANSTGLGFAPGQTLSGTILFEGAPTSTRFVEMNGTAGTFTIGATGIVRTETGLGGSAQVGGGNVFGGAMTLLNQGLISSQTSGRTVNLVAANFTNEAIAEAINGGILDISATNWSNAASGTLRALNGSTLSLSGNWSNSGALSIDNSTLNLGGTFSTAGLNLAGFSRTGGTVNLTGTLTNTASTLTLNSATGSWTLNGGTINGGTLAFADGQNLIIASNNSNVLSGVTVNGDLVLNLASARLKIAGGTTFTTAHMGANSTGLGFAPGQTLTGTILFEGAPTGTRFVEMNGIAGTFTIGAAGVMRTETGFAGSAQIGGGNVFGGAMTLLNQGLISSQTSGRTVTVTPMSFTNAGTIEAINGGVLSLPNGYTQTGGVTRVNDGTINSTTININAGTVEGSGTINATVNSSGIINLNADGTIAGPLNATGGSWNGQGIVTGLSTASVGTFTIGSGAHLRANGNLNVTGAGMIAAASATAKITGSVSYLSSANSNFGGIIAGTGKTVTMNNAAATFTLAGANTYTGATTVTAGILKAGITSVSGVSGAFGRNSPVTMANNSSAILDITGFDTQIGSLSGGGTTGGNVTLGAATLTFAGTNTSPAVYSGNISGTGGINKIGPGTQTFAGTNTYTGRTTISQGTLRLDFSTLATPTNILNSTSALTLGGGTFSVLGKPGAAVASAQTLGDLTLSAHAFSTIVLDPNNSGTGGLTLTLGNAWTRNPGSTLLIDLSSANTGTRRVRTSSAVTGSGAAGPNGIFGYALVRDSGGTGFAVQDGSFNLVRNTAPGTVLTSINSVAGTTTTDFTTTSTDPGYSAVGGTLTLDNVAHAANTLSINTTGGGTLNLGGASGILALTSNAMLVQGTGNYTIQNGALGASGSEVIVHQIGTGTLTISSAISGGAGALTKDGSGTLTLTGTQNYATLTATAGVTNLQMPLGSGTSTIHANATVNTTTSQTLAALNIGPTGVVALTTSIPAPLLIENDNDEAQNLAVDGSAFFSSHEEAHVAVAGESSVQAVPEPGTAALWLGGIAMLLARRRRSAQECT